MSELKYRFYCWWHYFAKRLLGKLNLSAGNILSSVEIKKGVEVDVAITEWMRFIEASVIPANGLFAGHYYAGYIAEQKTWCLDSWIWTNAAMVRMYCTIGEIGKAKSIADKLAKCQEACGGWIVRNDYDKKGAIPMLAPNDSSYIANYAFLAMFEATHEDKYLKIAMRCAEWIIKTARSDGMVYVGYNTRDQIWDKNCVIVDVGFTGGLFSKLVELTGKEKYLNYLKTFIYCFIDLFYIPNKNGFCTSIDKDNRQQGGMFGRGQAWALEGLIPAYKVLKDERIKNVINNTIENLLIQQHKNGAWAYNLTKPLMGEDCKSISVIAKNMMEWYAITKDKRIKHSAEMALEWCRKNTAIESEARGGIFSFCMEGAVVHDLYTSTAFVYASAYAIELQLMLRQ